MLSIIRKTIVVAAAVSPRRLYFAEDGETIVEEGDARASFLAVAEGAETTDPRVMAHLGASPEEIAATVPDPANAAPRIQEVDRAQSPTPNQEAHEAVSPTAPSDAEVVSEQKKEAARGEPLVQTSARTNLTGLPANLTLTLVNAGLDTQEKVREATDEVLLALEGVGDSTLAKIRAATEK